ncbi:carbonic anhydrase [Klebsormidium nitens]|uniref:carbonic anhydrase n=1 Tax=Klebsormidium nitens TaxID=105231 RepID=A0A1Y1I821_KLENI|nr:carbonic anhydrase [Klebsormidium nitens]|eukprot:GAQ85579.1 carbonic anhydrase [Klebsormidium nitens]
MLAPVTPGQPFNYSQSGADWGGLCTAGRQQSPIDISTASAGVSSSPPIRIDYRPQINYAVNTVPYNEWVIIPVNNNSTLTAADGTVFYLHNIHFHQVGEHSLDGQLATLEAHYVHSTSSDATATGQRIAVLAILFYLSEDFAPDPFLNQIVPFVAGGPANVSTGRVLDFTSVTVPNGPADYVTYVGSLTQPPCTEGVTWYVTTKPRYASQAQIILLMSATAGVSGGARTNNRPIQPLYNRTITGIGLTYATGPTNTGSPAIPRPGP